MNNIENEIIENNFGILNILHVITGIFLVFGLLGLLFYYIFKKDTMTSEEYEQAQNLLNFHISYIIYFILSFIGMFLLIGFITIIIFLIVYIVSGIIGFIKMLNGETYEFPWSIKFFK